MFLISFLLIAVLNHSVLSIKVVSDDNLISIIQENKDLLILFAKKGCIENCKYEKTVTALQDEIEASFVGCKIVKVEDSQLVRLYSPFSKEPALVFLRNGVPIIYPENDPDVAEEIFQYFNDNREPLVKELDDSNFEHLTQASTGSTTGNWLILFYDTSCVDCSRLGATTEAVAAKLKFSYTNVARVNILTKGIQTAKRFKVEKTPTFILIRKGKYYRYTIKKYDVDNLVGFAIKTFQNFGAESIKPQASPFENLVDSVVAKLKQLPLDEYKTKGTVFINENPLVILGIASVFVLYVLFKLFSGGKSSDTKKKEEKSSKKSGTKKEK